MPINFKFENTRFSFVRIFLNVFTFVAYWLPQMNLENSQCVYMINTNPHLHIFEAPYVVTSTVLVQYFVLHSYKNVSVVLNNSKSFLMITVIVIVNRFLLIIVILLPAGFLKGPIDLF